MSAKQVFRWLTSKLKLYGKLFLLILGICVFTHTKAAAKLSGSLSEEAIAARLKPTGTVTISQEAGAEIKPLVVAEKAAGPQKIYQDNCKMCHQTGLAGAPKFANKADWESRRAQGIEVMSQKAYEGFKGMPPKGNCLSCSKEDIKATIEYMLNAIK